MTRGEEDRHKQHPPCEGRNPGGGSTDNRTPPPADSGHQGHGMVPGHGRDTPCDDGRGPGGGTTSNGTSDPLDVPPSGDH